MRQISKFLIDLGILACGVAAGIGIGINYQSNRNEKTQVQPQVERQQTEAYSFDRFGRVVENIGGNYQVGVTSGDFDGDGDLDLAVASARLGIRIYENKMPQKTGEQR